MFVAYLAVSAGRVVIPEAVEVADFESDDHVSFIDANGRILVTFRRADLSIYSKDSDPIGDLIAREDGRTERKV
jgi:hypothetical protein